MTVAGEFYANGKLLISGEYLVLDGAMALAVPVNLGQSLKLLKSDIPGILWKALEGSDTWFEARLTADTQKVVTSSSPEIAEELEKILHACRRIQPDFLSSSSGWSIVTQLNFKREWGLGSSSTLIYLLAAAAGIDPFELHLMVSNGSGYDVACAGSKGPILYRLHGKKPVIEKIRFQPEFRHSLYFVYLGKKQKSSSSIAAFRKQHPAGIEKAVEEISRITESMVSCHSLDEFRKLMDQHESIMGKILNLPTLKETIFSHSEITAKALGAWGGDFAMLATGLPEKQLSVYLLSKGMTTCIKFDDFILQHPDNYTL